MKQEQLSIARIILIVVAFVSVSTILSVGYLSKNKSNLISESQTRPIAPTPTVSPYASILPTPTLVPISEAMIESIKSYLSTSAPANWGEIQKIDGYKPSDSLIPDTFVITYSTQIEAYYQTGVNLIFWKKNTGSYPCRQYFQSIWSSADDSDSGLIAIMCSEDSKNYDAFEYYLYNPATKKNIDFGNNTLPSTFDFIDANGNKNSMLFSPKGNLVATGGLVYEGCAESILKTKDGKAIYSGCGASVNLSADENLAVFRSDGGMGGDRQFLAVNLSSGKSYDILAATTKENSFNSIIYDALVVKIDDSGVDFKILNDDSDNLYHYDFAKKTLILSTVKIDNSGWHQLPVNIDPAIISQFAGKTPSGLEKIPIIKNGDLFTADKSGEVLKQLTDHKGVQSFLVSPDGSYATYLHAKGNILHPGAIMGFSGTLNLKVIDIASGAELRNIFIGEFVYSPSLEYFWDSSNDYIYIFFEQNTETTEGYNEKKFWVRYNAKENKSKFLTEQEFNQQKKSAIVSIVGSADLTYYGYPTTEGKRDILALLFGDLYDKISPVAKNTLLARYRDRTIHPVDDNPSYNYSSNPKEAFVSMSNLIFSPNFKKAAVYFDTSRCERMDYMITYSTPIFIIDLISGKITEISESYRFLSLVWADDENFLISDRTIYEVSLAGQKYSIKKFLAPDKNFISSCEVQPGPSVTLPCDGLGEALGPVEILTDPCSA